MSLTRVLFCLLVSHAGAMFQDQAGTVDWYRENIGRVRLTAFPPQTRGNKYTYVATDENIIAGINLQTGATAWRQVLTQGEQIDTLVAGGKSLFSASSTSRQLRMWNQGDGSLVWDDVLSASETDHSSITALLLEGHGIATLIDQGRVEMRSISSGRVIWTWNADSGLKMHRMIAGEDGIHVVGQEKSTGSLVTVRLSLRKGSVESSQTLESTQGTLDSEQLVHVFGEYAAYIDHSECAVYVHQLGTDRVGSSAVSSLEPSHTTCRGVSISPVALPNHVLIKLGPSGTVAAEVDSSLKLQNVHTFSGKIALSGAAGNDGKFMLAAVETLKDESGVSIFSLAPFEARQSTTCTQIDRTRNGDVMDIFLGAYTKTNGMTGARVLAVTKDHTLSLIQNGEALWQREEALAKIRQVEFAVPSSSASGQQDQASNAGSPWGKLEEFLKQFQAPQPTLRDTGSTLEETGLVADKFGFRRMAVVMTDPGKVLGLNTETSEVVWSRFYNTQGQDGASTTPPLRMMMMIRNTREASPECVVLGHDSGSTHFPTFLSSFNPLTGEEGHFQALPYTVRHAILLPDKVSEHRRVLLIVDGDHKAHVYPDTEEAYAVLARRSSSLFLHEVDKVAGVFTGYRVVKTADESYTCEQTWQVVLPPDEKIDALAQRSIEDRIFSPFHVTGGHDVLFKYLNPNLLVISTVAKAAPFFKNTAGASQGSVHLYALDTVSGRIVYHVAHPSSTGPTQIALSENWIVHSYWSSKHLQTELSVVEFWEDQGLEESTATLITKNLKNKLFGSAKISSRTGGHYVTQALYPKSDALSAFDKVTPQKEEQSFVLPVNVKVAGVTATKLGITSKQLLLGTTSDQLLALPFQMINPRRPLQQPTEDEMAEGLHQYDGRLPFIPTSILSYNHTIANLRGIVGVPADLESTSLVMAYGVDMFFIRSTPSKGFDLLNDDFNYAGLALTVVVLSVASLGLCWVVKKKDADFAWR